jgi:hypothetical protein
MARNSKPPDCWRVEYDSTLADGRPFRTKAVQFAETKTERGARQRVIALLNRESKIKYEQPVVVVIKSVRPATEQEHKDHQRVWMRMVSDYDGKSHQPPPGMTGEEWSQRRFDQYAEKNVFPDLVEKSFRRRR